jgi:hypothetical protein
MAGLLDWLQTPAGIGLLSAAAGSMAGARKGQPWNTAGRGLVTGLQGYAGAQDQLKQDSENAITKRYREMQMQKIESELANQKAMKEASSAAAGKAMVPGSYGPLGYRPTDPGAFTDQLAQGNSPEDIAFNQANIPAIAEGNNALAPELPSQFDPTAYKGAMLEQLAQRGMPEEALKYAPKDSENKPQLVTVYGEDGRPMQKWMRPGESTGVDIGMGKPEGESYKERTISPDGQTYIKQSSNDGGKTWTQIEGTKPYDIRAASGSSNVTVNGFPKETFKNERDLRNDFQGLPTTKAFREVQTSYDQIRFALKNPSAANDLAAATKFMKLLDPGSVVRESELGMAMAATGQFDRMGNYYNMLKTGQKLTPSQRIDFYNSANGLYKAATDRYNQSAAEFRTMAQEYQLNPDRIAKPAAAEQPAKPAPKAAATFDLPPNAKQYEGKTLRDTKSGKRFKSVNGKWVQQ